jgi:hypothetical protein
LTRRVPFFWGKPTIRKNFTKSGSKGAAGRSKIPEVIKRVRLIKIESIAPQEIDMIPAQGRDIGNSVVGNRMAHPLKKVISLSQVDSVPTTDGRNQDHKAAGPVKL